MSASTEGNTRLEIILAVCIPVTLRLENEALLANDKTEFWSYPKYFGSKGKLCVTSDAAPSSGFIPARFRMIEET